MFKSVQRSAISSACDFLLLLWVRATLRQIFFKKLLFLQTFFITFYGCIWRNRFTRSHIPNLRSTSQVFRPGCQLKELLFTWYRFGKYFVPKKLVCYNYFYLNKYVLVYRNSEKTSKINTHFLNVAIATVLRFLLKTSCFTCMLKIEVRFQFSSSYANTPCGILSTTTTAHSFRKIHLHIQKIKK